MTEKINEYLDDDLAIQEAKPALKQPPLYKVKKSSSEGYLQSDMDLERFVINSAIQNTVLQVGKEKKQHTCARAFKSYRAK